MTVEIDIRWLAAVVAVAFVGGAAVGHGLLADVGRGLRSLFESALEVVVAVMLIAGSGLVLWVVALYWKARNAGP